MGIVGGSHQAGPRLHLIGDMTAWLDVDRESRNAIPGRVLGSARHEPRTADPKRGRERADRFLSRPAGVLLPRDAAIYTGLGESCHAEVASQRCPCHKGGQHRAGSFAQS